MQIPLQPVPKYKNFIWNGLPVESMATTKLHSVQIYLPLRTLPLSSNWYVTHLQLECSGNQLYCMLRSVTNMKTVLNHLKQQQNLHDMQYTMLLDNYDQ